MSLQRKKKFRFQFGNPEYLESRSMLAGHSFAGAIHVVKDTYAVAASAQPSAVSKVVATSQSSSQEVELRAALADPNGTGTGSASYESETEHGKTKTSFSVQIVGATPSTTLDVAINSVVVGQIKTDVNGAGKLSLSSNPKGTQQPLPADFPTSIATDGTASVTVGAITGNLVPGKNGSDDDGSDDDDSDSTETHLRASLTDANSTATGKVSYESETERGKTKSKMEIEVRGAVAGSILDVSIDGSVVGQITINAKGRGKLVLSSNPKPGQLPLPANISAGSVVSVGSLTGTLATPVKVKK